MNICLAICALLLLVNQIVCDDEVQVSFGYKEDVLLDCQVEGWSTDDIEYFNVTNGEAVKLSDSAHFVINQNRTAVIVKAKRNDIESDYYCQSKAQPAKRVFKKNIKPFLYKPEKTSSTITEGGSVEFECKILFGVANITWVKNDSSADLSSFVVQQGSVSKLVFKQVVDSDKGTYICTLANDFGSHQEVFQLRVKDTLAALWPFLAIVAEVLILCIIILIYEKKCNKKTNQNEDEQEQKTLMGNETHGDVKRRK